MPSQTPTKYNVGGVALERPFKIRRLGHFGFNASNLEASRKFYFDLLGFFVTEPAGAGYFGRHAGDHHSFALFDKKRFNERQYSGENARHFRFENDINQITWQVQSVSEMAEASKYFRALLRDRADQLERLCATRGDAARHPRSTQRSAAARLRTGTRGPGERRQHPRRPAN